MTKKSPLLTKHLAESHHKTPLARNIKEVVYGGIDGIITTFAVVAGFSGASAMGANGLSLPITAVLLFGLANLLADGFSMGVSDFLSSRAERKLYDKERAKEAQEIHTNPAFEHAESIEILVSKGFSDKDARDLVEIYQRNPIYWTDFMMRYELEMPMPNAHPLKGALFTFSSFLVFGIIPLLPYIFGMTFFNPFVIACIFGGIALAVLGLLRARFTQENPLLSLSEIVGLGAVAAAIAYSVGTFFA